MKRETETELGFWFRFFLMAGNVHHHGNLGETELFSIFLYFHYTLMDTGCGIICDFRDCIPGLTHSFSFGSKKFRPKLVITYVNYWGPLDWNQKEIIHYITISFFTMDILWKFKTYFFYTFLMFAPTWISTDVASTTCKPSFPTAPRGCTQTER